MQTELGHSAWDKHKHGAISLYMIPQGDELIFRWFQITILFLKTVVKSFKNI